MPNDLPYFVSKWNASTLTERSAAQQHFRDLCEAIGVPHPTQDSEAGQIGVSYTYEKRVTKTGTTQIGYADVWKRGFFAWEYKSKGGDLDKAYRQLNEYHESLENPPLLIVCDFVRFVVHTKFENSPPRTFAFTLDDLLSPTDTPTSALPPLQVLRLAFTDYNQLRPEVVTVPVTRAAAQNFLDLAKQLEKPTQARPTPPSKEQIAHFLMRLIFCLFADSVALLPDNTFRRLVRNHRHSAISFNRSLPQLFQAMSQDDSFFGPDDIPYFNGGLFKDNTTIPLDFADLAVLKAAAHHDWSHVEPAIFGTLFERSLDSAKRSMIGAHYTSPEDILLLIEPVVIAPLLRRWQTVKQSVLAALAAEPPLNKDGQLAARLRVNRPALALLQAWASELTTVRILDPACGSGNFLYLALKRLLDLWQEARLFGLNHGLALALEPIPSPSQLFGIEIDFYAHEIASIVVWIGFLQWKHDHGVKELKSPILQPLDNIQHDDAILRYDAEGKPYEPAWPPAEFIVGNPPFLGGKLLRRELGDLYVNDLFHIYSGRVPQEADLVTYWFGKATHLLSEDGIARVGMLATQAIRAGSNRIVLSKILERGSIFFAWANREWSLDGASVRISMIAFDNGFETSRTLNGEPVSTIHADLSSGLEIGSAKTLGENQSLCFQGPVKVGKFEMDASSARKILAAPLNPNGKPNSDVLIPWINARDITSRPKGQYIVDFGSDRSVEEAAVYELPFEYVKDNVLPQRRKNKRPRRRDLWWQHGETNKGMRRALVRLSRYIASPRVSVFRFFVWEPVKTLADSRVVVIARQDDYFLGVLHSRLHENWALATSSRHGDGDDGGRITYNIETCFDTFPFPWPPGTEPSESESPTVRAIAESARSLVSLRDAWLNPPDTPEAELKKRTLTNLYNARPTWLANAHRTLDETVFAAYGWPASLTTQEILARLLALNHQRAAQSPPPPTKPRRPTPKPL